MLPYAVRSLEMCWHIHCILSIRREAANHLDLLLGLNSDLGSLFTRDGHASLLDDSTHGADRCSGKDFILDAEDREATSDPVGSDVTENVDEADKRHNERDTGVGSISNGTLDWGKDSAARDTHDGDTSTAASVLA